MRNSVLEPVSSKGIGLLVARSIFGSDICRAVSEVEQQDSFLCRTRLSRFLQAFCMLGVLQPVLEYVIVVCLLIRSNILMQVLSAGGGTK